MVVDDDPVNTLLLKELLNEYYEIITFHRAVHALEFLKKTPVDLVITDLMMPEMDGVELLKKIRKQTCQIPVIFLSAYNEPDKIKEAFRQGADDYLFKPMSFNKIINSVKRSLSSATLL